MLIHRSTELTFDVSRSLTPAIPMQLQLFIGWQTTIDAAQTVLSPSFSCSERLIGPKNQTENDRGPFKRGIAIKNGSTQQKYLQRRPQVFFYLGHRSS